MSEKINVDSGNPYRDQSGHFGTSPDEKLKAALAAVSGTQFVSHEDNQKLVASKAKEAKDKLAELRSKGSSDTVDSNWKPSGTEAEAKEFSKNSAYKGTLFHGTTQKAASSIEKTGFDKTKKSKRGANNFPGTIMLAADQAEAAWYGKRAGGDDGVVRPYSVISAKINSTKHKKFSSDTWDKFGSGLTQEQKLDKVFKDYDSFEISGFAVSVVAVKDPKQIMVFNNDKQ